MIQRRRLSRAQVAATPERGVSARMRWGDGPVGFALSREAMLAEVARYGARQAADDKADAIALAWQSSRTDPAASVVRLRAALAERAERRAVERTGRVLVAWLIGRWRR